MTDGIVGVMTREDSNEGSESAHRVISEWALGAMGDAIVPLTAAENLADRWAKMTDTITCADAADHLRRAIYGPVIAAEYRISEHGDEDE